jgi:DNA/RNA endonuclease YhcR with UshA esterase domain
VFFARRGETMLPLRTPNLAIVGPCPHTRAIRDAKDLPLGTFVVVEGVVTVAPGQHRVQNDNLYFLDVTAGIQVFVAAVSVASLGDSIRIQGDLGQFNQELQITQPTVTILGAGTIPEPREVTGEEVNARTFEGRLAVVHNAVLRSVGTPDGFGRHNVVLEAPDGQEFQLRGEQGGVPDMPTTAWQIGATYHVTGALGSFQGTAQMKPRSGADIVRVD